MYLEQLCFAIIRAGWSLTKIYSYYRFEQECFKKELILMNQGCRKNAKNSFENDFYKLKNNPNFGYDCHNNLDNCQFVPIFDGFQETTYLKRYYNYFDSKVLSVVSSDLIRQEIEEKYNYSLMKLSKDDNYYEVKLSTLNTEKSESLEAAENFDKKNKRNKKKRTLYHYLERQEEAYRNNKIKSLIDFDEEYVSSVKSLAVKKETNVNLTTRFFNGKILMFSKTSIQSFVYVMFPHDVVKKIYEENEIQKYFFFQNLTDTDSTFLFFLFYL